MRVREQTSRSTCTAWKTHRLKGRHLDYVAGFLSDATGRGELPALG